LGAEREVGVALVDVEGDGGKAKGLGEEERREAGASYEDGFWGRLILNDGAALLVDVVGSVVCFLGDGNHTITFT
jgi:hypothetical protein